MLLVLVVIPGALYYIFMVRNTSSLVVEISPDNSYEAVISLDSKLTNSWLPLLDRVLSYEKKCTKTCTFDPIPPAEYQLRITRSGSNDFSKKIVALSGEQKIQKYQLTPKIDLVSVSWDQNTLSSDEKSLLTDDVREILGSDATVIDRDKAGQIFVFINTPSGSDVGTFRDATFRRIHHFPFAIRSAHYDPKNQTFIITSKQSDTYVSTNQFDNNIKYTGANTVVGARINNAQWSVLTHSGVEKKQGSIWKENIRFTDAIDLGSTYRLGYISKNDTNKLRLSNYPTDTSKLLLLDRSSARVIPVNSMDRDIEGIFLSDNSVYAYDSDDIVYKIRIPFSY
ncbi:hypothetical protein CSB09_03395 [Candidatus Gracilibacteria bacterium]|nr:MAG: hypothetical protein CSB09_03395 [Candidatus Gracilibacteria bacterium]